MLERWKTEVEQMMLEKYNAELEVPFWTVFGASRIGKFESPHMTFVVMIRDNGDVDVFKKIKAGFNCI